MDMGPAATEAAEVTAGEVGAAEVASSEMASASKVASPSVATASVTSASGQGHRRNSCGATQKDSGQEHCHRFSNHRSLLHSFSKHQDRCTRRFFRSQNEFIQHRSAAFTCFSTSLGLMSRIGHRERGRGWQEPFARRQPVTPARFPACSWGIARLSPRSRSGAGRPLPAGYGSSSRTVRHRRNREP
jgi:hypothetical protein